MNSLDGGLGPCGAHKSYLEGYGGDVGLEGLLENLSFHIMVD